MHTYLVPVYATYMVSAIALTVWLARTLHQNGAVFLEEVFDGRPDMADSVNRLLVTGFYMLNLGYAFFLLKADDATTPTRGFEVLARKLGTQLITLALVHFVNILVFWKLRRRNEIATLPPPVEPHRLVGSPS